MKAGTRRKVEAAARVLNFAKAHPGEGAGYTTLVAQLDDAIGRTNEIAARESAATLESSTAVDRRNAVRQLIEGDLLRPLARAGIALGRVSAEVAGMFPVPKAGGPNAEFVTEAKRMLEYGRKHGDALVQQGLPPDLLDELASRIEEFDVLADAATNARRIHMTATEELDALNIELGRLVRLFGAHYRFTFRGDKAKLATWARIRRTYAAPQAADAEEPEAGLPADRPGA